MRKIVDNVLTYLLAFAIAFSIFSVIGCEKEDVLLDDCEYKVTRKVAEYKNSIAGFRPAWWFFYLDQNGDERYFEISEEEYNNLEVGDCYE